MLRRSSLVTVELHFLDVSTRTTGKYGLDKRLKCSTYPHCYGFFTLRETDSDSDSRSDRYIVLAEHVHIAQTRTRIPTPYFYVGQEFESVSVSESVSGNVNEPLRD